MNNAMPQMTMPISNLRKPGVLGQQHCQRGSTGLLQFRRLVPPRPHTFDRALQIRKRVVRAGALGLFFSEQLLQSLRHGRRHLRRIVG